MALFTTECDLRPIRGSARDWLVLAPLTFVGDDRRTFTVNRGFITDLASVPWMFRRTLPAYGEYTAAAVAHDFFYRNETISVTRKEADDYFNQAMKFHNTPKWKRVILYNAVRGFGRWSYRKRK